MANPTTPTPHPQAPQPADARTLSPRLLLRMRFVAANDNVPPPMRESRHRLAYATLAVLAVGAFALFLF